MKAVNKSMNYKIVFVNSIAEIGKACWDALAKGSGPFLRYDFLNGLEETACCNESSGWQPQHVKVMLDHEVIAVMPGYLKNHSYGEYVFDHEWANAYHQHGLDYYPKWISAIPFTPVSGGRFLHSHHTTLPDDIHQQLVNALEKQDASSFHCLFANAESISRVKPAGWLSRFSVQFQWHNYNYVDFDDFQQRFTSRKRKDVRKLYSKLSGKNITFTHATGDAIDDDTMALFLRCYKATYLKRSGHTGYLNDAFFNHLRRTMHDNMLIVSAKIDDTPVASALFFYDESGLYGRYWGALQPYDGLHFACCYFEGIKFAIEKGLPLFNPGTQGEHKILRGFEPVYCQSLHRLREPAFHNAVAHFLRKETPYITNYFNQAQDALPFNEAFAPLLKTKSVCHPDANTINDNEKENEI